MGCDIHMYPEVKKGDKWEFVYKYKPDDFWKEDDCPKDRANYYAWEDRYYYLFAILADVRNAWDLKPIAEQRGLPIDVSDGTAKEWEDDGDGHSHSWLSLKELLDFDWKKAFSETKSPFDNEATVLKWIEKLKELGDPENVRVVFWFDN